MANDNITMLKLKRMLQLLDAGKSMNDICRDLHMSKRTAVNGNFASAEIGSFSFGRNRQS